MNKINVLKARALAPVLHILAERDLDVLCLALDRFALIPVHVFPMGKRLNKGKPLKLIMHAEKAQIGIEVMAIVAVMMLLLLPLTYVLLVRGGQFNEQAAIAKADENAARIAATADQVGSMGPGSQV